MKHKNSQASMEFMVLIGFIMFVFLIFIFFIQKSISEEIIDDRDNSFEDINQMVQDEINFAYNSLDGYRREFYIPENIGSVKYNLSIYDNMVHLKTIDGKYEMALPVKDSIGKIQLQNNIIKKENGIVKINTYMSLSVPDFNDSYIPEDYSLNGGNVNPGLNVTSIPTDSKDFAIVFEDIDSESGNFVHWILSNISIDNLNISKNSTPIGAIVGKNDFGNNYYNGTEAPVGKEHRYYFRVYALDKKLNLTYGFNKSTFYKSIKNDVIDETELMGIYIGT